MSLPPVSVSATAAFDVSTRVVARFDDGSETDLSRGAASFIALGYEIVCRNLEAAPAVAALLPPGELSLDTVMGLEVDNAQARLVLEDAGSTLFVVHTANGDEVLTYHGALTLIAVAVSALLELDG